MNKQTRQIVGINVKRFREKLDISVAQASETLGVHRSYWNYLENGSVNFTIDKLEGVANLLNVSVPDLLTEPKSKRRAG